MKLIFIFVFLSVAAHANAQQQGTGIDSLSAIKIAEQNWKVKYGQKIYYSLPFVATLKNDSTWKVKGTLEVGATGGTPYAEIRRSDGKVLFMIHTK